MRIWTLYSALVRTGPSSGLLGFFLVPTILCLTYYISEATMPWAWCFHELCSYAALSYSCRQLRYDRTVRRHTKYKYTQTNTNKHNREHRCCIWMTQTILHRTCGCLGLYQFIFVFEILVHSPNQPILESDMSNLRGRAAQRQIRGSKTVKKQHVNRR